MEIDPTTLPHQSIYKILTGSVIPRPIGWISTVDIENRPNLAPFSFFNVVCSNPPTLLFCPLIRNTDGKTKDTLRNVKATHEFVVNIVNESTLRAMNASSIEAPPQFNEFEYAGLTLDPSVKVKPPRVKESPIHFECRVRDIVEISAMPGGGSIVIGTIMHMHVAEAVLVGQDKINIAELKPVGRLMGGAFCRVTDLIELERPKSLIGDKG